MSDDLALVREHALLNSEEAFAAVVHDSVQAQMRIKWIIRARLFASLVPVLCGLMLAGCATSASRRSVADAAIAEPGNPDLLYLRASPCSRLYVEVDAVEGCVPKDSDLQKLQEFLATYCDKPDGIEIVRSDVIPAKAAQGLSSRALARKYLNGPGPTNTPSTAFLYVLYFDDTLGRYPWGTRFLHRGAIPQTDLPYPAIYLNTHFSMGIDLNGILLHETGHNLGLVSRSTHARGGHCLNWGCLMGTDVDYLLEFRWLPGRGQTPLCPECVAELKERATQPPPVNLRFVGPVLVRSEAGYHLLSLPARDRLLIGDQTGEIVEKSCQAFAASVRAEQADGGGSSWRMDCVAPDELLGDPVKVSQTIERFKNDPSKLVQYAGPKTLLRACGGRYHALGQYSNAVATLQQALLIDSEDDWSYNQLAWLEATCSDASVRNGPAAVTAATKACELTKWKNWQFIDTLAAACAEAGDFKHAIEHQQRALHTGHRTDSEQKRMQDRLLLYQQSEPFRDKP